MSLGEQGLTYKQLPETLVASIRLNLKERKETRTVLQELAEGIPPKTIAGPAFRITHFITSVREGADVEVGFPVNQAVETGRIKCRLLPAMEVVSLIHRGPLTGLGESYAKLFGVTSNEHGLISDELCREVYLDSNDPEGEEIELQFIVHNWNRLFSDHLAREISEDVQREVMQRSEEFTVDSRVDERFQWVRGAVGRLCDLAKEDQIYEVLSRCSHIFPQGQIEKLGVVYEAAIAKGKRPLEAVDAVIEFMGDDPGWGERPRREGNVIYSAKKPRDPQGFKDAKTEAERRRAYCFCPLVRSHMEDGMPVSFCYCGAGWYRQQWEGAIGQPVRMEIVKSLLKGDDVCEFAVYLPEENYCV
jgi:effector-binding domain-containing protein